MGVHVVLIEGLHVLDQHKDFLIPIIIELIYDHAKKLPMLAKNILWAMMFALLLPILKRCLFALLANAHLFYVAKNTALSILLFSKGNISWHTTSLIKIILQTEIVTYLY